MQSSGSINDGIIQVVAPIAEFGGQNRPVFETGENMLDDNASLGNSAVMRLLLVSECGCRIGFGLARSLVRDVQFQGLEIIGKTEIAQVDPHPEACKPIQFWGKLGFEETIIMLTAPNSPTKKENLAAQTGNDGIF